MLKSEYCISDIDNVEKQSVIQVSNGSISFKIQNWLGLLRELQTIKKKSIEQSTSLCVVNTMVIV